MHLVESEGRILEGERREPRRPQRARSEPARLELRHTHLCEETIRACVYRVCSVCSCYACVNMLVVSLWYMPAPLGPLGYMIYHALYMHSTP